VEKTAPNKKDLAETLSRGQKKTLLIALISVLAELLEASKATKPVFLLDDLESELDGQNLGLLMKWLNQFDAQVFITSVAEPDSVLLDALNDRFNMFHVEHGKIKNTNLNIN
jgi:DNA replication and repair protein RecF